MKKDRTCSPTFTGFCYNSLQHNFLNFLRAVHRLISHRHVVFTALSFNQGFWVFISTVPPGAHTLQNISARISWHFIFSPDEDSCINYRNVGKFSKRVFMFLLILQFCFQISVKCFMLMVSLWLALLCQDHFHTLQLWNIWSIVSECIFRQL